MLWPSDTQFGLYLFLIRAYYLRIMLRSSALDEALHTLGAVLAARGQTASLVLVGGGALVLLGHDPSEGFREMMLRPALRHFGLELERA